MLFNSVKALTKMAQNIRDLRLEKGLTQSGLAERSGVSLATLRRYEQQGKISLESFFKLAMVLGCLDDLVNAVNPVKQTFTSLDEVLKNQENKKRQRGWKK
ncbi:MAG: helix-turn-helix transcriptional regulator [Reichenbachiella sp.]|uniref:helix-turn-helix domain-containing protein n=1 Tax=Reichenbachiella sp. TaxID=2184521 RepID=UPI002965FDCF|nr:helix-turn-helix transcriptional regulator [Reichenbachiella sp.]MDW3209317.1 helix-turn-helix transcriptional regulator [Reichenbachiella sp.]